MLASLRRLSLALCATAANAADNATVLITQLSGEVRFVASGQALEAFTRIRNGDRLTVHNARIRLVYLANGRQETWNGSGQLEISDSASRSSNLSNPEIQLLPASIRRQLSKTPAPGNDGPVGMTRLRSLETAAPLNELEQNYRLQRQSSTENDINPELCFLAGLFELREFERLTTFLQQLQQSRPQDHEIRMLAALYRKAMRNAVESRGIQ